VTPDGEAVESLTLASASGVEVTLISYGAAVQQLWTPDKSGQRANVALGFSSLSGYTSRPNHYFGAVIGRYANRIAGGEFKLDGATYELVRNDGANSLHGGSCGFDKQVWSIAAAVADHRAARVVFRHTSRDLEMGYPGTMQVEATYTLSDWSLRLDLRATCDKTTVVNLTGHTLWNLAGEGTGPIDDHLLTLNAARYTPVDRALIPSGEIAPVHGTPLDFTTPTTLGARIDSEFEQIRRAYGYDHNFVVERPAGRSLVGAARLEETVSGRRLDIRTTEPGVQLYTGNQLDGSLVGTGGQPYRLRGGVALETQHFPDSVHNESFPATVLRPGGVFASTTIYRFSTAEP
jgi:aldose 1-epimerase